MFFSIGKKFGIFPKYAITFKYVEICKKISPLVSNYDDSWR